MERAISEKKALHEIEPGARFRHEHNCKTALRLRRDPRLRLLEDMGGMIIEDRLDCGVGWIRDIAPLEESECDRFRAAHFASP